MTKSRYEKTERFFNNHAKLYSVLKFIYKYSAYPVYLLYPLLIVYLFFKGRVFEALRVLTIPAVTFISITIIRKIINRPRPYEALGITPLITKNKIGESFPSRHAASVFIIALAFWSINIYFGIAILALGIIMCLSRVLAGVHYISDVAAGAVISIILGIFGFFVL